MKEIATIVTPFCEKFGAPRQSLLVSEAKGKMVFPKNDFYTEAFRGIEGSSHLWLIFQFHLVSEENISALVRPPRFQGKKKLGVFATRSPHRPNRLGLSVVKFEKLEVKESEIILWVSGVDLVSGTPIYDIKPYVPYVDRVSASSSQDFPFAPAPLEVLWRCERPSDHLLIEKVLALDPRPGHLRNAEEFGVSIDGKNIKFKEEQGRLVVLMVDNQKYTPTDPGPI
jgi:tRNA-Thr(GGU) m(6)t(6)A37 methyltransferase TsaA